MHPEKAEFKRLIDLMGWTQSEAARQLRKTPGAINHLLNTGHPNRPTQTTMQLLKLIIIGQHPELLNTEPAMLRDGPLTPESDMAFLSKQERELIQNLRRLPPEEQEKIYAVISTMLKAGGSKSVKYK